jgi:hypothetical protein
MLLQHGADVKQQLTHRLSVSDLNKYLKQKQIKYNNAIDEIVIINQVVRSRQTWALL